MDEPSGIRALVASMLMIRPERVDADTSMRTIDNSLSGARLRLGLKRLGFELSSRRLPATFGELERLLETTAGSPAVVVASELTTPTFLSPAVSRARIGHDIQDLESMPDTADFWTDAFYLGSFSQAELAYAVVQATPKQSLAGFWAAKEALRKCDPVFIPVDFSLLSVAHCSDGSPCFVVAINGRWVRLQHSVSISHTKDTVSAVVLTVGF